MLLSGLFQKKGVSPLIANKNDLTPVCFWMELKPDNRYQLVGKQLVWTAQWRGRSNELKTVRATVKKLA